MSTIRRQMQAGAVFAEHMDLTSMRRKYTVSGNPQPINSPFGPALDLDGAADSINFRKIHGADGSFAVSMIVSTGQIGATRFIGGTTTSLGAAATNGWGVYLGTSGTKWTFYVGDGVNVAGSIYPDTAVVNQLYKLIGVFDASTKSVTLYVDTVAAPTGINAAIVPMNFTNDFLLGKISTSFWNGKIAEPLIYPRLFSSQERSDISNGTAFDYMQSLVAHYDMSTINPVNLCPKTYGSLNGTGVGLVAATDIVNGVGGGMGTEYNGSDETTLIANNAAINFGTGDFSVSGFFKTTDANGSIFEKRTTGANGTQAGYAVRVSAGVFNARIDDGAGNFESASGGVSVDGGALHHFVTSYARSNNVTIFLDGVLYDSQDIPSVGSVDNDRDAYIASREDADLYLAGLIDELMFFNSALTQLNAADLNWRIRTGRL